jgi:tetratricopeptide (TPR) repeat protein
VQREFVLLLLLSALTIPFFLFTRSMAARNRAAGIEIAKLWYQSGRDLLQVGNTEKAIAAFRSAATNDHDNKDYARALANALAQAGHTEEARESLLRLRASAPEDGAINLSLARLSGTEDADADAVRYYHNALFGNWPPNQELDRRRSVRTELVRFLLSRGDRAQALSELLILSSDIPDADAAHNEVGSLFLESGDSQHALEQFTRAVKLNPKDGGALRGAGEAAFNLADYAKARRYLEGAAANGKASDVAVLLETTRTVLSWDPLVTAVDREERIRRMVADLEFASKALQSCIEQKEDDRGAMMTLTPLSAEIEQDRQGPLRLSSLRRDSEAFNTGVNLVYRVEVAVEQICGGSSPARTALLLIARKHGAAEPQ